MLADRERKVVKTLVETSGNAWGLAWGATGRELWFTEGDTPNTRDVLAVDPEGRRRLVYRSAAVLGLIDVASDGRALFHRSLDRYGAMALLPGSRARKT